MTTFPRLIRLPDVEAMTGLRHTAIYELEAAGKFPRRRKLTARSTAWLESEVAEWVTSRPSAAELRSGAFSGQRQVGRSPAGTKYPTVPSAKETVARTNPTRRKRLATRKFAEASQNAKPVRSGVE